MKSYAPSPDKVVFYNKMLQHVVTFKMLQYSVIIETDYMDLTNIWYCQNNNNDAIYLNPM